MINLLPPQYKEELRGEEHFRLVLILGLLLTLFFICLSLAFLSIRVYVSGEIQAQRILVESQRATEGDLQLAYMLQLNSDIAEALSFYGNKILLSDVIAEISSALPKDLYITSISFIPLSRQGGKDGSIGPKVRIALMGFAPQTNDLLQLRENLEKNPAFVNFRFPSVNWVRPADIDFSFDFEL